MKILKVKNPLAFSGQFESIQDFNSTFLKTKMKVFAFGKNLNGSSFDASSFIAAAPSMSLIPIVAKYNEEEDDLEGHNVELKVKDDEFEFVYGTSPIGVVSNTSNITFEEVNEGTELSPNIKTYVVIDNVFLWKRYEATKRIESWLKEGVVPKLSMEIGSVNGEFSEDGYFQISDFEFEAITALGSDVEPCFPRAEIETYSKQSIKDDFKKMVYELSEALNLNQEGGNKMPAKDNKDTNQEPESTVERTILDMFTAAQYEEAHEMNTAFNVVEPEVTDPVQEFALTASQLREQLRIAIGKEKYTDQWGDVCRKYWYVDHTDSTVIVEDYQDGYQLYSVGYTLTGDTVAIQTDTAFKVKVEYVPFEGESVDFSANLERFEKLFSQSAEAIQEADEALKENYQTLESDYEVVKGQLTELQSYKRQREEEDVKAKFSGKLSDEELTQVFTELKDADLVDVEKELFALIGQKNFSIQKKDSNSNVNKVVIPQKEDKPESPYGDFFAD